MSDDNEAKAQRQIEDIKALLRDHGWVVTLTGTVDGGAGMLFKVRTEGVKIERRKGSLF